MKKIGQKFVQRATGKYKHLFGMFRAVLLVYVQTKRSRLALPEGGG